VEGKELRGTFSIFGASAEVEGVTLSEAEAKALSARKSFHELFEARRYKGSEGDHLGYRLFVPKDYDPKKEYPLILFHHGGGGAGSDNRRQLEGALVREWVLPDAQKKNPCFIVAPQIPGKDKKSGKDRKSAVGIMKRRIRAVHEILDQLEKEFPIDKSREYVTGLSFGGECTWLSLLARPKRFAAAVPICAGARLMDVPDAARAKKFARFPLWIFHGDADRVISVEVSRSIVTALKKAGGKPKYTEYPGVDHYSWDKAYRDPELVEWLFAQSRKRSKESAD
ncbi:MAG: dienelactone hydrolase family protein, partial [Planctomycetota bacterium]